MWFQIPPAFARFSSNSRIRLNGQGGNEGRAQLWEEDASGSDEANEKMMMRDGKMDGRMEAGDHGGNHDDDDDDDDGDHQTNDEEEYAK